MTADLFASWWAAARVCRAEHERRARLDPGHDRPWCWCACRDCPGELAAFRARFGRPHARRRRLTSRNTA